MQKNKFFDVLKTFSKEDYYRFKDFVNSDYNNKSETLRNLYGIILKYSEKLLKTEITKEIMFNELYPGKEYNESRLLNLLSGLYKLSEDYIAEESFRADFFCRQRYLLKGLGSRNLQKYFVKCYEDAEHGLNKLKIQSEEYFNYRYDFDVEYLAFATADKVYSRTDILQAHHDKMIDFILVKILITYIFMLNQKKYGYEHKFKMTFLDNIIEYCKKNSFNHAPAILMHFNLMMLLKDAEEQYYFRLKELFKLHPDILDKSDKWTAYVCMVNYCETRVDIKETSGMFSKEVNELYRTIIEDKIYQLEDWHPFMHHRLFLNVVQNGLFRKDFQQVEHFINSYKDELSAEHKFNMFNLCYALFYFHKKDYEKSLETLAKVQSENISYFLHIKALTLQNYYELNLYDNALSTIDAYKHFLKQNQNILARDKIRHVNFVNIVQRILKIKCGELNYNPANFVDSEMQFQNMLNMSWVNEKITEIKQNGFISQS